MAQFADRSPALKPPAPTPGQEGQTKLLPGVETATDTRSQLQRMADARFERRTAERKPAEPKPTPQPETPAVETPEAAAEPAALAEPLAKGGEAADAPAPPGAEGPPAEAGPEQKPAVESNAGAGAGASAGAATPPPAPEAPAAEAAEPEAKQGEEKDKKEGKEGEAEEEEKLPDSPKDPKDDPAFQAVLASNTAVAGQQAAHTDPEAEVTELQGAAVLPEEAQAEEADMEGHMGAMEAVAEQQERKPFTPATFKEKLKSSLEELEKELPNDADSAEEFKEEEPIGGIKEDIAGQVAEEKNAIAGPLEATAGEAEPPATGAETVAELPLEPEDPGAAPAPLNPAAAVPKPFADHEISLEKESASLDEKMAENNVTEEQLEKSNEPEFLDGLSQKREAQQKAAEAPGVYRGQEAGILGAAQAGAAEQGEAGLQGMFQAKNNALTGVLEGQGTAEIGSETEQDRIKAEFQKIYDRTKESVNTQLEAITTQVTELFDTEAEAAKTTFEDNVEEKLDDIYGVTVIDDWLFGEDTEAIEKVFVEEKATFVATMDRVLDRIATIIADGLNAALATIAKGRDESKVFFDSLDESQKKLAQDSFDAFNDQYTSLEDTVYEKEDELARDLAQSYKDNVAGLRESFDKIKDEVSAGWIGGALNALVGIIETIIKIGEMLANLLSAVVEAIGAILEDPIGFLSNLIDGVKLGFEQFFTNIKTHIISGLIEWLTGSLGGVGITLPENIFSLAGVFDLTMQILGLGWDYLRDKAVKLLGEPVVQAMEMGAELFIKLKNGGIDALWEELKEQFQDIQQVVMDAIRDMVITKVIEAGIKWIMGLLSPAGAFIKAAMMIIDIVTFFVERAASIIDLVMAFIDGIRALANGDVSSVANAIEKALAKAIPILIGFLAALVGVTGLAGKVQNIVKKIRKRVDKAVTKVIKKIGKKFKGKGKKGKKGSEDDGKDDGKPDKDGLTPADKKKHAKIAGKIKKQMLKPPKGKELSFEQLHAAKKKEAASLEQKYQKDLNPNIKLSITLGDLASDKKDGDLDIQILIAPNTTKVVTTFYPDEVDDERFTKLVYKALEQVAAENYQGGTKQEAFDARKPEDPTKNIDQSTVDEEKGKLDAQGEAERKKIAAESKGIHQKVSLTQSKYRQASKAQFYPNNTFSEGSGSFFVETDSNFYVYPKSAAEETFRYKKGQYLYKIFETQANEFLDDSKSPVQKLKGSVDYINQQIAKITQTGKPAPANMIENRDQKQRDYEQAVIDAESWRGKGLPLMEYAKELKPESVVSPSRQLELLNFLKANYQNQDFKTFANFAGNKLTMDAPAIHDKYDYGDNPISPEAAKIKFMDYPKNIFNDVPSTVFLGSILAEPSRYSVAHITNLLLLHPESDLDSNSPLAPKPDNPDNHVTKTDSYFSHSSMSQKNTDRADPTTADIGEADPRLDNPAKARNVTNRDLAAIKRNPKLEQQLKAQFEKEGGTASDDQLVSTFKSIISKYVFPE
jgi:hypothetical protein